MDLFDIFGITEEELKDEKKASAKPKKKEKKKRRKRSREQITSCRFHFVQGICVMYFMMRPRARGVKIRSRKTSAAHSGNWLVSSSKFLL
jgi:hypothetical protein